MTVAEGARWRAIQRIVLPTEPARLALYARGGTPESRTAVRLTPGERVSFGTYFGGIPLSYWHAHTNVRSLRLTAVVDGAARIEVRRTDEHGQVSAVDSWDATGQSSHDVDAGGDTGWLWFEAVAADTGAVLHDMRWETADAPVATARVSVAITTFNRESDCVRLLERLAADGAAIDRLDRIVVADQGTRRLDEADGFTPVAGRLDGMLRVVRQANLGGSGGFSRGMIEALDGPSTHVLLLDDDVDLETESLMRLAAFAEHAHRPLIAGAQMLSLTQPTVLHSYGERVDRREMWWGPVDEALSSLDLQAASLETTPGLSRRLDVDFNGWWMCLIPVAVVRRIGASLPMFIKWDDAEYGLRAAAAGVPTVTLPGAALWHMPWVAKDDGLDWQAYFQLRNRVITALVHGGRGVLRASLPQDANHIVCAQYGSAALRNLALRDVLSGPQHVERVLREGPARPNAVLHEFGQRVVADPPAVQPSTLARPQGALQAARRAARVLMHQLRRQRVDAVPMQLPRDRGKWWALGVMDAAVVDSATGSGAFVLRRERAIAARQLAAALSLRWQLWWRWRALAKSYCSAAREDASVSAWRARFDDSPVSTGG